MFDFFRSTRAAELASALFVIAVAWVVGHGAAEGFSPQQWIGGLFAIGGAVWVAAAVRVWPVPRKERADS